MSFVVDPWTNLMALGDIAARHLQGWPTAPADEAERAASRERALALGAKD